MEHSLTKDVFVLSDNIISALGFSTLENIEAVLNGKTGISRIENPEIFPEPFLAATIDKNRLDDLLKLRKLEHFPKAVSLVILSIQDALQDVSFDLTSSKTQLILSTTKGNIDSLTGRMPPEEESFLWHTGQTIAGYFQLKNSPLIISNACISGIAAIETADRLLRSGQYENIIVTGFDLVSAFTVSGFQSFKSLSEKPCKPYDAERDGLSLGEAAATILLTNREEQLKGKEKIYILGGATSNDANHISGPSRTGDGLHYAIENAIRCSGINKKDIDFINLHGTATPFNDEMESKALALSGLSETPAGSYKGYFGHTLGASGVVESILCAESIRRNQMISTLGFSQLGVPEKMNIITENASAEIHTCLKTASGFGGFNAAIILSDKPGVHGARYTVHGIQTLSNCKISQNQIFVNGNLAFENQDATGFTEFIKSAFKQLEMPYMKFYKMDNLCKLGFTAAQYLLSGNRELFEKLDKKKIAIVLGNSVSSLDTDIEHQCSINDFGNYFPSPSVFVYTLPNIVIGEICIKEKIQGEVSFFIFKDKDHTFMEDYVKSLFDSTETEAAITGWVHCLGEDYEASLSLIISSTSLFKEELFLAKSRL